jgi:hypothetical protein
VFHRLHKPQFTLSLFFSETDGWTDIFFRANRPILKEGDLQAPRNNKGTLACDSSITWTAGECFAAIFAMRDPSIPCLVTLS